METRSSGMDSTKLLLASKSVGDGSFCPPGLIEDERTGRRFRRVASFQLHTDAPPPWSLPWWSIGPTGVLNCSGCRVARHHSSPTLDPQLVSSQSPIRLPAAAAAQQDRLSPDAQEPPTPSGALAATANRPAGLGADPSTTAEANVLSPQQRNAAPPNTTMWSPPTSEANVSGAVPPQYQLPAAPLTPHHNNSGTMKPSLQKSAPTTVLFRAI